MEFRRSLFWDVDPQTIDLEKNARYIIERVLDFGSDEEVRWMWGLYPRERIRDVIEHSRVLQPHTRALWNELIPR